MSASKFNVGDRVAIAQDIHWGRDVLFHKDSTGTVDQVEETTFEKEDERYVYRVTLDNGVRTFTLWEREIVDLPRDFTYTVTVTCETQGQADQVMAERLCHDEDYGFEYRLGYERKEEVR